MTALALALMGLAPSVVIAAVYWIGRSIERHRALEAPKVINSFGILSDSWPPPPPRRGQGDTEPHIEVLKLRAAKLAKRLGCEGEHAAARHVDNVITAGDRDALLAVLREEGG
jgi:hypothetical protein